MHTISTSITKPKFKQRLSLRYLLHKCFRYIKLEHPGVIIHIHDTADGIGLLSVSKIHFYGLPDFCGAVSYTHLDVYKRQDMALFKA